MKLSTTLAAFLLGATADAAALYTSWNFSNGTLPATSSGVASTVPENSNLVSSAPTTAPSATGTSSDAPDADASSVVESDAAEATITSSPVASSCYDLPSSTELSLIIDEKTQVITLTITDGSIGAQNFPTATGSPKPTGSASDDEETTTLFATVSTFVTITASDTATSTIGTNSSIIATSLAPSANETIPVSLEASASSSSVTVRNYAFEGTVSSSESAAASTEEASTDVSSSTASATASSETVSSESASLSGTTSSSEPSSSESTSSAPTSSETTSSETTSVSTSSEASSSEATSTSVETSSALTTSSETTSFSSETTTAASSTAEDVSTTSGAPSSTTEATSSTEASAAAATPDSSVYDDTDPNFQATVLDYHNQVRSIHQAGDLVWNDTLASFASDFLGSSQCVFDHSGGPYGENLSIGYPSILAAMQGWYDENSKYDYQAGEFSGETGHFTQMVWKDTRQIGCATIGCDTSGIFLACEYADNRGNIIGAFLENVLAPVS